MVSKNGGSPHLIKSDSDIYPRIRKAGIPDLKLYDGAASGHLPCLPTCVPVKGPQATSTGMLVGCQSPCPPNQAPTGGSKGMYRFMYAVLQSQAALVLVPCSVFLHDVNVLDGNAASMVPAPVRLFLELLSWKAPEAWTLRICQEPCPDVRPPWVKNHEAERRETGPAGQELVQPCAKAQAHRQPKIWRSKNTPLGASR